MTGWQAHDNSPVKFNQKVHELGEHIVYGKGYKQGVILKQTLDVIPDLCARPSCREFIAIKLCRHFICDEPTKEMVGQLLKNGREQMAPPISSFCTADYSLSQQ